MDNNRADVYHYIMNCGIGVRMSTYATFNGVIDTNYVVLHNAPPRVLKTVLERFKMVSLTEQGVLIPLAKENA